VGEANSPLGDPEPLLLLVVQGFIINRAAGINSPMWSPLKE
jgi:hypothetical protein